MNRSILALAGSTLIFGSASAYFWQQERVGDERNAALEARVKELETTLATSRSPPSRSPWSTVVEQPAPTESASPPAKKPAAAAPKTAPAMVAGTFRSGGSMLSAVPPPMAAFRAMRMDKLMEDPEYRAAMRAQHRMMMSTRYPDLQDALGLQPEDMDKLMELLTDQEMASMANQPPFGENGQPDPAAMQEWSRKMQQRQRDNEAQLAGVLGDTGLQDWKKYQQTLGARMQVKQLRGIMEGSSDPIRQDQVQPLVDAMAAEQQRMMEAQVRSYNGVMPGGGGRAALMLSGAQSPRAFTSANQVEMMEKSLEQTTQSHQRMHEAVAPYLTQRQLEQFDRYQNQQLEFQRANLRMMRARAEAEERGEIPQNGNGSSVSASSVLMPMVSSP